MAEQIRSVAMSTYRFFAVNDFDRVTSLRWIECMGDADAKARAGTLVTKDCGIEVWDVGRCVSKLARADKRAN